VLAPDAPSGARAVFGDALPVAVRYAELLAGPGVGRGLIGPAETARLWERHLLNCAVLSELVPARGKLIDIGSGAGLPGLVLAMVLPGAEVILLEPMARRTAFLKECVAALELANVTVRRGRAQEFAGRLAADAVTARALAPLDRLAALAVGVARPDGLVLAIKGAGAAAELAAAGPALRKLGITDAKVQLVGETLLDSPTTVIRFRSPGSATRAAVQDQRPGQPVPASRRGSRAGPAGDRARLAQAPSRPSRTFRGGAGARGR
jgi:16S rRNA (guanine527-N7)-methyltransferase